MKEIHPRLYVGNNQDYLDHVHLNDGWAVIHACKEPYHRMQLGYLTKGAPRNHPEYLYALRDSPPRISLNLVDADDPAFIPPKLIEAALKFIDLHHASGSKVLCHCNQGQSRAPAIALAWLAGANAVPRDYHQAVRAFTITYPDYHPKGGMTGYLQTNWRYLCQRTTDYQEQAAYSAGRS